jgi:hypothetical protein
MKKGEKDCAGGIVVPQKAQNAPDGGRWRAGACRLPSGAGGASPFFLLCAMGSSALVSARPRRLPPFPAAECGRRRVLPASCWRWGPSGWLVASASGLAALAAWSSAGFPSVSVCGSPSCVVCSGPESSRVCPALVAGPPPAASLAPVRSRASFFSSLSPAGAVAAAVALSALPCSGCSFPGGPGCACFAPLPSAGEAGLDYLMLNIGFLLVCMLVSYLTSSKAERKAINNKGCNMMLEKFFKKK